MTKTGFMNRILNLVYPKGLTCNFCGRELNDDEREFSTCKTCTNALRQPKANPTVYDGIAVHSSLVYEGGVRKIVLNYKDGNKPYLTEYMAKYMFETYKESGIVANEIAFVPSGKSTIRKRGYDAMKFVAEEFSALSGIPFTEKLLKKDGGKDLSEMTREERVEAVKERFYSCGGYENHVLLLDDLLTTGATVCECASVILSHGAETVTALTFAVAEIK